MTSLEEVVKRTASGSLPEFKIHSGLKVLGFSASTFGIYQALTVATTLSPHFKTLARHFPLAGKILADFQSADEILHALGKRPIENKKDKNRNSRLNKCAPFCEVIASDEFKSIDFIKHPHVGELFSFFWLAHTCIHAYPGSNVPSKLERLLHASLSFVLSAWMVIEDIPEFGTSWKVSLQDNLTGWFQEASKAIEQASNNNLSLSLTAQEIFEGLEEARDLIYQLPNTPSFDGQEITTEVEEQEPRNAKSIQRGAGLYERERLSRHHNAFQHDGIEALAKLLRGIIEQHPGSDDAGTLPPYYLEATIISLALATGRKIEGALQFPLNFSSTEYIKYERVDNQHVINYPIWHRTLQSGQYLRIPLPSFLAEPIARLFNDDSAETIEDCLPYSVVDWEYRCISWLENNISGTSFEINRRIRDALAREIYKSTASPALLVFLTTPVTSFIFQTESLSKYTNPLDERTLQSYQNACTQLFKKYGAPSNLSKLYSNNEYAVSESQHRQVAELFIKQIESAKNADDFIAHHNWIARYILMLLVVSTGHRKSLTPFYFPWDILIDSDLAFLCDKLTVGSEARFLPIPKWLTNMVLDYRTHLLILAKNIYSTTPHLSKQIEHLAHGGDLNALQQRPEGKSANSIQHQPEFGQFFKLAMKANGQIFAGTLSTADIVRSYTSVYSGKIGEFRKSAANSLWSSGHSGHQTEAFLGHNGELHSFGESSAWTILGWANEIRAWQEQYLKVRGWIPIKLNSQSVRQANNPFSLMPSLKTCSDSYEGRHREHKQSLEIAIGIIRANLPANWFLDKDSTILDQDLDQLKEIVKNKLQGDPKSCEKVNQALAQEIDRIRKCVGKVSSTITNLTRTEPCPIPVHASRNYAVASNIRLWWQKQVGRKSISETDDGAIERLAEIGISLIILDAVLDEDTWANILEGIAAHELSKGHSCILSRTQIKKRVQIYDKEVILSIHSSALVLGYEVKHSSFAPKKSNIKLVYQRINKLLRSMPTGIATERIGIQNLFDVFKSWWQIRLPGAQFSIAIGEHSGPAADIISTCAMYELPCGGAEMYRLLTTPKSTASRIHVNASSNPSPKYAHSVFNNFLNYVNGKIEDKNASTRLQRQRLSQSLINHNSPAIMELVELSNRQPIISLMLEFLLYMLEEGGEKVEVLAFSAMRTYISNARNLIDVLWDKNILDFETADFDNSYSEVIKRSEDKSVDLRTPLSLFHKFLREVYGAPPSYVAYTIKRLPAMCRTSIVTPLQNEETWQHISSYIRDDGQISHHSKTFLYLIYNHAVRSKEAFGIRAKNVISRQPCAIKISSNAARSLKTGNSFRVTKSILASAAQEKYFNSVVEVSNKSPRDNPYLFDDLEIKGKLYPTWKIGQGVTTALRHISGNPRVVPYSMRHSAATRLVHWTFKPPRLIPLSIHVENTLKGSLKVDSIFELFDNGFSDWPFWVDSVGMHLGHAGTSTIANTYWHTSSVRLAEHTWHAAENLSFTDEQIANMLGRDRSTLSQQRKRLQLAHNPDIQKVNSTELVICHYINKSKIPTIGESLAEESLPKFSEVKFKGATHDNDSAKWSTYDRLLCERLDKFLTFEQTIKLAIRLGLNADVAKRFIDTYVETAKETEIFDFEPANSEILIDSPKQCPGVLHGAYERERRLTAGHRLLISNDRFREIFGEFLRIWFSRVKSTDPWFIARNESEFQLIIDVLLKLGAKEDQLEFCCCNFDVQRIRKLISKKQLEATTSRRQRLSKGSKATLESEIGINVGQISLSEIGDNRDTHRLILMLAAISRIEPF